ncbi:hypothetical protein LXL04_007977 [Taraxacum kok-saghyz]
MEGKGDSDDINLADDDALFTSFPVDSTNKRKNSFGQNRATKSKTSYEEKLDVILEALSTKSTQTYPQNTSFPTLQDFMPIVSSFLGFEEGLEQYAKALFVLTKKTIREAFTYPTTDSAKLDLLKLHVPVFRQLCKDLVTNYGLTPTCNISIEESVAIFLICLAHGCTNRFMQELFNQSGETISRDFHMVLEVVLKMSAVIIKPDDNYNDKVPDHILNNPRYYPFFKDCIGAIDGTHVKASVAQHEQAKYIGRKGHAMQNIMDFCDFNMCFTFKQNYVVDAGYPNTRGYLAPYKGATIRYHLPDFQRGQTPALRAPRGAKETFNFRHSSLRNIIERTFGVWKARWTILRDMHVNFTYDHQVKTASASMAMHNYIRKGGIIDE